MEIFTLPEGTGFLAKYMFFSADRRTGVAQPVEPDPMKYPATARLRGKTLDRNTRRPRTAGPGASARNPRSFQDRHGLGEEVAVPPG